MSLAARLDALLASAATAGVVPGVAAVVVDRDGVIYAGGAGERVKGGGAPMTPDTVGWIASCTKALTGAVAMQFVERGDLDLDAPAREVVPGIAEAQVLTGFDAAGQPTTRAPKRPITLRHLLTHSAGFSYELWNTDIQKAQAAWGLPGITECRHAALKTPLLFDPGERWEYGINIDWAGKMVEAVSGRRLGEVMRDTLLAPLAMRDTAFRITPSMRERFAKLHHRVEDGSLVPGDIEITQEPEFEMGGGGLYGTPLDYARFIRMMLCGGALDGERVLRPETVALMGSNHLGSAKVTKLATAIPPFTNDAEFFPGVRKSWGLSFQINDAPCDTGRGAGVLMWAGLSNCYYFIDTARGFGGFYMTQILPFADVKSLPLYYAFERAVYDAMR